MAKPLARIGTRRCGVAALTALGAAPPSAQPIGDVDSSNQFEFSGGVTIRFGGH